MPSFIRRGSGLLVPVGHAEVDYSHPLAQGLVSFYVPKLGLQDFGPAGVKLTPASGWGAVVSSRGGGMKGATTSQYASVTTPTAQQIPLPLSVFWHGDPVATSTGNCTYFGAGLNSAASPFIAWEVGASGTGLTAQYNINSAGAFGAISGGTMPTNKPFSLGMSVSGSAWRAFMSGRVDGTPAGGQSNPSYTGTYSTTIGTYAGATTRVPGKITNAAGLWRRVLTDTEFAWLEAEPFAFFQTIKRRQYYLPSGGGITGTLNATISAFTLSGAGAVALAGTATPTISAFTLSGSGAVALAGTGAITLPAFTLSGAGAVALTGAATPTIPAFTLSGAGSIALTGAATPTIAPFTLSGAGAALITGTATITLPAFTLAGDGTVAAPGGITGTLTASLGNFTLSGLGAVPLTGTATPTIPAFTLTGIGNLPTDPDGALTMSIGDFGLSGFGTITGLALTDITVRVRQNYLLPPPRVTGNTADDFRKLNQWCHELHDQLVVADNALGVLRAMISNTKLQVGLDTNVAEQFARMIEKINQLTAQITALELR